MKLKGKKRDAQSKKKSKKRGTKYWASLFALSSLMAGAPCTGQAMTLPRLRATRGGWEVRFTQEQAQRARQFKIPAGPLEAVLEVFQQQTGLRVIVPIDAIRSIASLGVSGRLTAEQALEQLLAGTGVTYRFTDKETVTLEISGLAASVEVIGRDAISSPKFTEPLRDTPQTITIISKSVIEEQAATTLRDVLRNVPGLTMTAGEGGAAAGDNLTLRGFSARNDVFVDGVRDLGPQSRDPFNLEQVEVVKGPSSAFNGRGSAGGAINLVSKSPGLGRLFSGGLNFGSDRTKRLTGDINLPLKAIGLGERTAFRLNALWHESGVAGRDVVENRRWGIAPSLAFGLESPTRLLLSYFKLKQDNVPDYGIPWVTATHNVLAAFRDRPAPVPRESFYGLRSRDFEHLNSDLATVKFERDFDDNLNLRTQFRYGRSTRNSITTAPRFAGNDSLVINR
ncbi:MAG TPA: TonB-dependent receptor plug domain-containing protein, partial [Blastocatellia bacterium]|nr:TonB-dependent receptor plug domain-containing protein [Blastocatellia bacterium]